MREALPLRSETRPGRVFYDIRPEDVGTTVIETTEGRIYVSTCLGRVIKEDIGRRLYRIQTLDETGWIWQAENDVQRRDRLGIH